MKPRNILILSIVFLEILFLGFSSTYELPAIDTDEMKSAAKVSAIRFEKARIAGKNETKRIEALECAKRKKEGRFCFAVSGDTPYKLENFPDFDYKTADLIKQGRAYITSSGKVAHYEICGDFTNKWETFNSFDFTKEHEQDFIRSKQVELKY